MNLFEYRLLERNRTFLDDDMTDLLPVKDDVFHTFSSGHAPFVCVCVCVGVKALEEQQKALVEQIGAQEAKVKRVASDARRVKTLQAAVAARGDARDAAAAASDVEAKVQALHGQIVRLTEGKMNSARQKLDAVVAQIKKVFFLPSLTGFSLAIKKESRRGCVGQVNDEKTKLSVAIRTSERNAAKTLDKVASLEQEVAEAETDLRQLQERRKQIEEQAMGHKSSQEALELAEKDLKAKLAQFKTELDAALKSVAHFTVPSFT